MKTIRVFAVDDHPVVLQGILALLEQSPGIEVVGSALDGTSALEAVGRVQPDVVLLDVSLPDVNGIELCRRIATLPAERRPAVVMLTVHQTASFFFQALRAGALGYVPKSAPFDDVREAIESAARGETYLHPSVAGYLVSAFLGGGVPAEGETPLARLSEREREVLGLLARGRSTREIAAELGLSPNTVHKHRTSLMAKLGLHSAYDLLRFAASLGLVGGVEP
ncbi:MAG: response regulator transcription factor [Clostridia bacterium]|nr:response regulator transcription factor [Clostridia bacterium]